VDVLKLDYLIWAIGIIITIVCLVLEGIVVVVVWIASCFLAWALVRIGIIAIMLIKVIVYRPWLDLIVLAFCVFELFAIWVKVRVGIILRIARIDVWIKPVWVILWQNIIEGIIWIHVRIVIWIIISVAVWIIWVRAWHGLITVLRTIWITASASDRPLIAATWTVTTKIVYCFSFQNDGLRAMTLLYILRDGWRALFFLDFLMRMLFMLLECLEQRW